MQNRTSDDIIRETNETKIKLSINIDGAGKYAIDIPIGFLKHMLELFARHGFFDLKITASGDTDVDYHHTVEDIGICLGQAFKKALGDMKGIKRYGFFILPMDESLAEAAVDICNRPVFVHNIKLPCERTGEFDAELAIEFLGKFALHAGLALHIKLSNCANTHHGIEAVFKCLAKALDAATSLDTRVKEQNTTKGII